MPGPRDHIAFLSQEVGPRPAGTEEEQQAALYITEELQKEAGFSAVIEDFNSESNEETPRAICALVSFVFTILAMVFSFMVIPSLIIAALSALLYVMESFDRPVISRLFTRGVSQNVIAKYEPGYSPEAGSSRRRKIILVANYDSGKVRPELNGPFLSIYPLLQRIVLGAMVFIPVLLLIRFLFFSGTAGASTLVIDVITIIALVLVAIPILLFIIHRISAYNEAANCNASGVAILLEVARRIGRGRVSGAELAARAASSEATVHGEDAARSSGLVPEGAQLVYEASQMIPPEPAPQTEEERLAAAKAAIAALTGRPAPPREQVSIADHLVQVKENPLDAHDGEMHDLEDVKELREETREALTSLPPETLHDAQEKARHDHDQQKGARSRMGDASASPEMDVQEQAPGDVGAEEDGQEASAAPVDRYVPAAPSDVPDWFKKAQENAKRSKENRPKTIQRSRYADALDTAVAESSSHFNQANRAVSAKTEERLKKMRDGIMEVSAPQISRETSSTVGKKTASTAADAKTATKEQAAAKANLIDDQADLGSTVGIAPINVDELRTSNEDLSASVPAIEDVSTRQPIVLPDIGASATSMAPVEKMKQQRAPLAVAEEESSQVAAKSLLNMLPSIDLADSGEDRNEGDALGDTGAVQQKARPNLRNTLPSLSGAIKNINADDPEEAAVAPSSVSMAGSFASAGATGAFAPVGDELLHNVDPDDIYVDDADDSVYEGSLTETGAFAGPGYVEMPKSRARRFFDRFSLRKNKDKNDEVVSAREWLDVDEDFEAQSVGAARGGWESFQYEDENPQEELYYDAENDEFDDDEESKRPHGNHYSRIQDDEWEGGAYTSRPHDPEEAWEDHNSIDIAEPDAFAGSSEVSTAEEMQRIQQFRHPDLNTEVWFVALGSELANNGGIKALIAEHEQDMRGSIVINLNGLGAGELCYLEREGLKKKGGASSRMKRYIKKASQNTGIAINPASVRWLDTAASVAARKGFQAMSIMGMEGDKPARFAQGDDVLENIDEEILQTNADFIMELLKNI